MNVLAVDDERLALMDLMGVLSSVLPEASIYGFQTVEAALEYAGDNAVDIAFLDVEMKGTAGLELAKRLKNIREQTNIIFVTGHSQYAVDAFSVCASDYILKPVEADDIRAALCRLRSPVQEESQLLRVQCFGNFEVFSQGKPVEFSRSKAKELFAYLIHKRGTGCSIRELCAVLFEDKSYNPALSRQMQVVISSLMKTLEGLGAKDTVVKKYNSLSIDTSKVDCDYYRFLSWDTKAINSYSGEYLANYSWAEFVVGYLDSKVL